MFNPRFPHTLRVWRARKDSFGEPETDADGEPIYDIVMLAKVITEDGMPVIGEGGFETEEVEFLPFGYRNQGKDTRDTSEVEVSDHKLATPMFVTPLDSSDRIELTDFDRTYWCEVVRKATYNLGSNIWVNEVKG
jgi:hypothetical protein